MSRRTYHKGFDFTSEKEVKELDKVITELEKKLEEKSVSPSSNLNFLLTERTKFDKTNYAEELKMQMDMKSKQKEQEKIERKIPAISEAFHGYPNLPQTPEVVRRQRELAKMKQQSNALSQQLAVKRMDLNTIKSLDMETARQRTNEDLIKFDEDRQNILKRKETEKRILVNAWSQAQKAKELQVILEKSERKGLLMKNLKNSDTDEQIIQKRFTEDESSQINFDIEPIVEQISPQNSPSCLTSNKKQYFREKITKMKESMDQKNKGTYQYKIKQIIENAKKQREDEIKIKKNSLSSTRLFGDKSSKNLFVSQRKLNFNN